MTQSPPDPVSENTEVTFTCATDEAEPTSDVVWNLAGSTKSSASDSTEEGMYNAHKKRSVLILRVNRTLNMQEVECYINGTSTVNNITMLDVRCKFLRKCTDETLYNKHYVYKICKARGIKDANYLKKIQV